MTGLLDEWAAWQLAQGLSEHTVNARLRRVQLFAAMVGDPAAASSDDVVAYMASLPASRQPRDGGVSKATRATYYSHIRAWFKWLVSTGRRDDDPTIRLPAPKPAQREPRPVTPEQFELILATRMHRRTRMMVYLASFQGLRAHEIAKFRGEDIDRTAGQLTVIGKGESTKVAPLHPVVAEFATSAGFPARGWWFPSSVERLGHIKARSVSDIIGDVLRRAGVPKGAAHRLRHTFATTMVANGENLRVVQELLRHKSLQTTQIYTNVSFDQQRAALERLRLPNEESA